MQACTMMNAVKTCRSKMQSTYIHMRRNTYHSSVCSLASSSDANETQVQPPNVRNLAKMANIGVTDEEVKDWAPKIEKIVEWFDELQNINLEGVEPSLRADVDSDNSLRPDQPRDYENKEELLSQVPDMDGSFVKVPKTKQGQSTD